MKLEIIGKNYDVGVRLKEIIEKKVLKLGKYFGEDANCKVVCKTDNKNFKLEITITEKSSFYRAEVMGESMYDTIDIALPKIEKQIVRHSGKKKDSQKQLADPSFVFLDKAPEPINTQIKRRKKFTLETMKETDAIEMLDILDHDFYLFINAETGNVNLVYRRKDESFGLIEVEN